MSKDARVTYIDFLVLFEACSEQQQNEYTEILRQQPRPIALAGDIVPENLNGLTFGQLDDLRRVASEGDIPSAAAQIIFGKPLDLRFEDVNKVFGFLNFCTAEIKRINELFSSMKTNYSSEEIAAGVQKLDFGSFGVLDWYAKRMGIINQNDVRDIAWVRIYQCLKNDHEQQMYERRLQDQYMKKSKAPSKR